MVSLVLILTSEFILMLFLIVGEFNRSDASVQVTGLQPGCYYSVRAIATNAANFSSLGPLIRLRTVPLTGHEQNKFPCTLALRDSDTPGLRTSASTDDTLQHGPVQQLSKRTVSARRTSSTTHHTENHTGQPRQTTNGSDESGPEETIPQLNKRLDFLRRQQDEIDKQVAEEEEEAERSKTTLLRERDLLKQTLKEKEEAQLEFKKQVNELEKQSKATQRKKSAKERLLYQKQSEKRKMREEVTKWDREIEEMRTDAEAMCAERTDLNDAKEKKIEDIRKMIADCQAVNKAMEEEIRIKGNQIKILERERKNSDGAQNEEEDDSERIEKEREQAHEARMHECQVQYSSLWKTLQQVGPLPYIAQRLLANGVSGRGRKSTGTRTFGVLACETLKGSNPICTHPWARLSAGCSKYAKEDAAGYFTCEQCVSFFTMLPYCYSGVQQSLWYLSNLLFRFAIFQHEQWDDCAHNCRAT